MMHRAAELRVNRAARGPAGPYVGWLCATALLLAAATAFTVNSLEAALFGERTTAIATSCWQGRSSRAICRVAVPQQPHRTFVVDGPLHSPYAGRGTEIAVRYRDGEVVEHDGVTPFFAVFWPVIMLCIVAGLLAFAARRVRNHFGERRHAQLSG